VDLTLSGETLAAKREADPVLTPDGLRARVPDYVGGADAADPYVSPIFGDLRNCPRF
jgi:epsilon-lactone hydrolase